MNDSITCPDCKSNDVQKIEKKRVIVTASKEWITMPVFKWCTIGCTVLGGVLGSVACFVSSITGSSDSGLISGLFIGLFTGLFGGLFNGLFIGLVAGVGHAFFFIKTSDAESKTTYDYSYACRSCGKEFSLN